MGCRKQTCDTCTHSCRYLTPNQSSYCAATGRYVAAESVPTFRIKPKRTVCFNTECIACLHDNANDPRWCATTACWGATYFAKCSTRRTGTIRIIGFRSRTISCTISSTVVSTGPGWTTSPSCAASQTEKDSPRFHAAGFG